MVYQKSSKAKKSENKKRKRRLFFSWFYTPTHSLFSPSSPQPNLLNPAKFNTQNTHIAIFINWQNPKKEKIRNSNHKDWIFIFWAKKVMKKSPSFSFSCSSSSSSSSCIEQIHEETEKQRLKPKPKSKPRAKRATRAKKILNADSPNSSTARRSSIYRGVTRYV